MSLNPYSPISTCEMADRRIAELVEAIAQHRTDRYGSPPVGPFFATDTKLYKLAGIENGR